MVIVQGKNVNLLSELRSEVSLALMQTISGRLYSAQPPRNAQENWKANRI